MTATQAAVIVPEKLPPPATDKVPAVAVPELVPPDETC